MQKCEVENGLGFQNKQSYKNKLTKDSYFNNQFLFFCCCFCFALRNQDKTTLSQPENFMPKKEMYEKKIQYVGMKNDKEQRWQTIIVGYTENSLSQPANMTCDTCQNKQACVKAHKYMRC